MLVCNILFPNSTLSLRAGLFANGRSFSLQQTRVTRLILIFSGPPLASGRERGLARKDGRKRQDTGIQEHLAQVEIHPVPDEERLESAEE